MRRIDPPCWSIKVEWQIYLLMPLLLLLTIRFFGKWALLSLAGGLGVGLTYALYSWLPHSQTYIHFIALFAVGMVAAQICCSPNINVIIISVALGCGGGRTLGLPGRGSGRILIRLTSGRPSTDGLAPPDHFCSPTDEFHALFRLPPGAAPPHYTNFCTGKSSLARACHRQAPAGRDRSFSWSQYPEFSGSDGQRRRACRRGSLP